MCNCFCKKKDIIIVNNYENTNTYDIVYEFQNSNNIELENYLCEIRDLKIFSDEKITIIRSFKDEDKMKIIEEFNKVIHLLENEIRQLK